MNRSEPRFTQCSERFGSFWWIVTSLVTTLNYPHCPHPYLMMHSMTCFMSCDWMSDEFQLMANLIGPCTSYENNCMLATVITVDNRYSSIFCFRCSILISCGHFLVKPNLQNGQTLNALNLPKCLSSSKTVYLRPNEKLYFEGSDAEVSLLIIISDNIHSLLTWHHDQSITLTNEFIL